VGPGLEGRANATINFAMFVAAFVAQYAVGVVISFFHPSPVGYAPEGYALAFGLFLALQVMSIVWYLTAPKETI
jgi:hypothetical protein